MKNCFIKKIKEKVGQSMLEYLISLALLLAVSMAVLTILPKMLQQSFNKLEESMEEIAVENNVDENTLVVEENNINNELNIEMSKNNDIENVAILTPTTYVQQEKKTNKISFIRENEEIFCEYKKLEQRGNYYYIETNDRFYWLTPNEIETLNVVGE